MLEIGNKYGPVPARNAPPARAPLTPTLSPRRGEGVEAGAPAGGAPWKDVDALADSMSKVVAEDSKRRSGVQILVPSFRGMMSHQDWRWKELREGGILHQYLRHKRATTASRWSAVARARSTFRQNNTSSVQLLASVPGYDFFRWRREDPDFWKDKKNLKALKRDNPGHVGSVYV